MLSSSFLFEFLNLIHIWLCQNSFTLLFFSINCLHIFCIHAIFGVRSSLSRIAPENLIKISMSDIAALYPALSSIFLKILYWSLSKILLSIILLPLLIIFTSFISVYLSFSIHPSLCFIRTGAVSSVLFIVFLSCLSIFSYFGVSFLLVCPFLVVLSNITHYWHCTKYEVFHRGCLQ